MTPSQQVKEIRLRLGLTQSELAEKLGLSGDRKQTISRWEQGKRTPSPPVLIAMRAMEREAKTKQNVNQIN